MIKENITEYLFKNLMGEKKYNEYLRKSIDESFDLARKEYEKLFQEEWENKEFDYYKKFVPGLNEKDKKNGRSCKWKSLKYLELCKDNYAIDDLVDFLLDIKNDIPFIVYDDFTNVLYKNLKAHRNEIAILRIIKYLEKEKDLKKVEKWFFVIRETPIINDKHLNYVRKCLKSKSSLILSSAINILRLSGTEYKDIIIKKFNKLFNNKHSLKYMPYSLIEDFCEYFEQYPDNNTIHYLKLILRHKNRINCINTLVKVELLLRNLEYKNKNNFKLEIEYANETYTLSIPTDQDYKNSLKYLSKCLKIDITDIQEYIEEEIDNLEFLCYEIGRHYYYCDLDFNSADTYTYLKNLQNIERNKIKAIDKLPWQYNPTINQFVHKLYINRKFEII